MQDIRNYRSTLFIYIVGMVLLLTSCQEFFNPDQEIYITEGELLDDWNEYVIQAVGPSLKTWVNGVPCADFRDDLDTKGFIGLQVHGVKKGSGPYQVRWRNIRIMPKSIWLYSE